MKRKILGPYYYPGTLEVLRTAICQLAPEGEWVSSSGARVGIFEYKWLPDGKPSPYYAEWVLRLISADPKDRSRCATMTAQQLQGELLPWGEPESVYVFEEGRDATWSLKEPKPMGDVLVDLYRAVFREVHWIVGRRTAQAEGQVTTPEEGGVGSLPPVTDPTDQRILEWITSDPDLTDREIGQRLSISRQAANTRRRKLGAMGYSVR